MADLCQLYRASSRLPMMEEAFRDHDGPHAQLLATRCAPASPCHCLTAEHCYSDNIVLYIAALVLLAVSPVYNYVILVSMSVIFTGALGVEQQLLTGMRISWRLRMMMSTCPSLRSCWKPPSTWTAFLTSTSSARLMMPIYRWASWVDIRGTLCPA